MKHRNVNYIFPGLERAIANGFFGFSLFAFAIASLHGDNRAPTFDQAFTNITGSKVFLTYDENLYRVTASPTDFTVTSDLSPVNVTSVNIRGTAVALTLESAIAEGEDVTISYTDPSVENDDNAVQDSTGNDSDSLPEVSVANHVFDGSTHSFLQWGGAFIPDDLDLDDEGLEILQVIQAKSSSYYSFAALRDDGSVKTWGLAQYGGDSSSVSEQLSSGVTKVISTLGAFAALKEDGSVVTWGHSSFGGNSSEFEDSLVSGVKDIYATTRAFAALKYDGSVLAWGHGYYGGELGRLVEYTKRNSRTYTEDVSADLSSGVIRIAANEAAFAALKDDGSIVAWGNQSSGGKTKIYWYDGSVQSDENPTVYEEPTGDLTSDVTHIFSNRYSFAALKADGSVVSWGAKDIGGDNTSVADDLASGIEDVFSNNEAYAAVKEDGSVVTWGRSHYGGDSSSVSTNLQEGVERIFNTWYAFAALKADGSVVTWGNSSYGGNSNSVSSQLSSGVSTITNTDYAFAALRKDGSVAAWGHSTYGGYSGNITEDLSSGVSKVVGMNNGFAALKEDGTLVSWGYHTAFADMNGPSNSGAISNIVPGQLAYAAFREDGAVITWGEINSGGNSSSVADELRSGITQIFSNSRAFVAVREDGDAFTWGSSSYGGYSQAVVNELNADFRITGTIRSEVNEGNIGDMIESTGNQLEISRNSKNGEIFNTSSAFAALKEDGSVVTWGNSGLGGDSSSVNDQLTAGVDTIISNANAFAALKDDGSVITWGHGSYGGEQKIWLTPTRSNGTLTEVEDVSSELTSGIARVVSNDYSFTALTTSGKAISWGIEHYGGTHAIASHYNWSADPPYELSDAAEISAELQAGVVDVSATRYAYAALKDDGSVVTWGSTTYGGNSSTVTDQLQSDVVKIYANMHAFAALKSNGGVVTWGHPSWGGNNSSVSENVSSDVVDLSFTNYAFAALKSDGSVHTWGSVPNAGNVADDLTGGVVKVVGNNGAFAALKDDGSVVTWGTDTAGGDSNMVEEQLASGIQDVVATQDSFAAYKADGSIVTWGNPYNGGNPNHFDGLRTNEQFGTLMAAGTSFISRIVAKAGSSAPDNKVPADASLVENTGFAFTGFYQISVDDPNDDVVTVELSLDQQGTLNIELQGDASISSGSNDSSQLSISGSHAAINSTLATMTYNNFDGYTGTETLTVLSTDGTPESALTDTDAVPITVLPTPVPPSLVDIESTAGSNNYGTFSFLAAEDGQTGLWGYALNPSVVQFVDADEEVSDSVTITATDGMTKTVIVDIVGDNDPLTITSGSEFIGDEDAEEITGTVVAVDPEGREGIQIEYALDESPTSGSTTIDETTGAWSYVPDADFHGEDTFVVSATDDLEVTTLQTITITVSPVNDAPVLESIGNLSTQEDTPKNHTLSASDVDEDTLTFSAASSSNITAEVSGTTLTLTPKTNWSGTENVTITVTDTESATDTETIAVTVTPVNDLPILENPGDQEFTEKDVHPVELTLSDVETASPSISVVTSDPGLQTSLQGNTLNLTADGWYGDATVTVTVTDEDQAEDSETFNVTVIPFNIHPPVHTVPGEQQIDTSVPYTFSVEGENAIQVDDQDSTHVTMTLEVQYGVLKLQQSTGLEFLEGTSDNSAKLVITGSLGDLNAALDGLRYCSTTGYVGGDTISLHTEDHGELTDTDDILLTVEIVALPGQPNLQVSTLVEPGKTLTNISIESFDDSKLQLAEFIGEGENLELAILPIGKQDGSQDHSTVEIELTYDDGSTEVVTVPVVIYHAKLAVTQEVQGIAQINRSTGLYESIVEVENTTPYTMEAIRIHVDDIKGGAELKTITGTGDDGVPYVQYDVPLTPGEVQNFKLEFKVPGRRWDDPTTSIVLELLPEASEEEIVAEPVSLGEEINQAQDQSFYISFETVEAQTYYIQYADTIEGPWKTSPISIQGDNLRQVWVDDGPPKTLTHPSEETSRVYRIVVPVENQDQD